MSADGQHTKCRRNVAENFDRLSRVHERYRQTNDRQTNGRQHSEREREFTSAKIVMWFGVIIGVTGQLADTPTRGLDISWTRQLDRALVNSRTGQVAYWTTRGLACRQKGKLSTQSRRWRPRVVQSATCPVRELSSPRVDQSARCPVRESSSPRDGNPRVVQ